MSSVPGKAPAVKLPPQIESGRDLLVEEVVTAYERHTVAVFDPADHATSTTRGLGVEQMPQVAAWIDAAIEAGLKDDDAALDRIAGEVRDLLAGYPMPGWAPTP